MNCLKNLLNQKVVLVEQNLNQNQNHILNQNQNPNHQIKIKKNKKEIENLVFINLIM